MEARNVNILYLNFDWFGFLSTVASGRVDNVYGDRNLICTLQPEPVEEAAAATA